MSADAGKILSSLLAFACAAFVLRGCSGDRISVSFDEPVVRLVSWNWWGLSKQTTPITWRETEDETGWMAKDKQGHWYVAIGEPEPIEPGDYRQ